MNQKTKLLAMALFLGLISQTKAQNLNSSVIDTPFYLAKMIPTESATSMRVYVGNIAHKKLQLSIKDIEGNEIPALYGAKNLITTYKPVILIELWKATYDKLIKEEIYTYLTNLGYKLTYLSGDDYLLKIE